MAKDEDKKKKKKKSEAEPEVKAKKQKVEETPAAEVKKEKKEKKKDKEKKEEPAPAPVPEEGKKKKKEKKAKEEVAAAPVEEEGKKKKEKKEKKVKKEEAAEDSAPPTQEVAEGKKKKKKAEEETEAPASKKPKTEPAAEPAAEAASEGGNRVYIGNLPWSVTEEQLKGLLGSFGEIEWLMHTDTGKFKGAVFATFATASAAQEATAKNGADLDGRAIKVELATPKRAPSGAPATNDPGEPNESVFLGNLSWSVDEDAVRNAFADCGEITRVKFLEKDGQFMGKAFLDFDSVESATKAVAKNDEDLLGRPMRLNFGKKRESSWGAGGDKWGGGGDKGGKGKGDKPQRSYTPAGPKPDGCVELFCGNLSYSIDEDKVADFFKDCGTVVNTRWLNDRETQEFKGIGFVTFETTEEVDKAVKKAGEYLDGRQIRIDYAGKKKENAWGGGNKW